MMKYFTIPLIAPIALAIVNVPTREIAPGVSMPLISIGTGGLESSAAMNITMDWLELGGRGVDTAYIYRDQNIVAKAIADAGISRKDVFITTKIPGCLRTQYFVEQDLKLLGTDYIDLLLVHEPIPDWNCAAAWTVLEDYHSKGVLKAIGVSNFKRGSIEKLMKTAKIVPAINQIQHNILEHDDDTIACLAENNITLEAYSPLGRSGESGNISGNPVIKRVAANHNVSTYQVALKWILQQGHVMTFQSSKKSHQEADADVFKFNLTASEIATLDKLGAITTQIVV